jgi:hypothetical protein
MGATKTPSGIVQAGIRGPPLGPDERARKDAGAVARTRLRECFHCMVARGAKQVRLVADMRSQTEQRSREGRPLFGSAFESGLWPDKGCHMAVSLRRENSEGGSLVRRLKTASTEIARERPSFSCGDFDCGGRGVMTVRGQSSSRRWIAAAISQSASPPSGYLQKEAHSPICDRIEMRIIEI